MDVWYMCRRIYLRCVENQEFECHRCCRIWGDPKSSVAKVRLLREVLSPHQSNLVP
jgi:hypothetical protein